MERLKTKNLTLKKVILSMVVIMLVWFIFWYPLDYFVFPPYKNLDYGIRIFLNFSREFIRMIPAICYLSYYKSSLKTNLKEMFSLKFNYKVLAILITVFAIFLMGVSYFRNGKIYFNPDKMHFFDVALWLSLGLCQEIVFRGWSLHSFSCVTSHKNAITWSSFLFAASHWFAHFYRFFTGTFDIIEFIQVTIFTFIFGIGMCLILTKAKSKSLIPCIIFHAFWDFLVDAM